MHSKEISILVVDDEVQLAKNIKIILERVGYQVDTAFDGKEGIEKLRSGNYHIVITDLVMPEVDGFAILEFIKQNFPRMIGIVITAYASVNTAIEALRYGTYDFLIKPFDNEILILTVNQAVEKIAYDQLRLDFISMITHDIKSPLTSIIGYSELLSKNKLGPIGERGTKACDAIHFSGRKILALIEDFLTSSRIEEGRLELSIAAMDLRTLLYELDLNFKPELVAKKITLTTTIPEDFPEVYLDDVSMERIFVNMISNSLKFTPPHGEISIDVRFSDDLENILLTIADNGCGVPLQHQKNIFDKFKRVKGIKTNGTGLGLYICRSLITLHGGTISIEDVADGGTKFSIVLPNRRPLNSSKL